VTANKSLGVYYPAKLAADEALYREGKKRGDDFAAVSLRPGWLNTKPAGKVELGKTKKAGGSTSRATVAQVAELLFAADGLKSGWLDLLDGDEDPDKAVEAVIRDAIDTAEGEPVYEEK